MSSLPSQKRQIVGHSQLRQPESLGVGVSKTELGQTPTRPSTTPGPQLGETTPDIFE